LISSTHFNC